MKPAHALILAVVQSLTEFVPVSSSGHLVIASKLLGAGEVPVLFDLVLHMGTLTAVVVVYASKIRDILSDVFAARRPKNGQSGRPEPRERGGAKLLCFILLSTAVTGAVGVALRAPIVSFFHARAGMVPLFLLLTGAVLVATRGAREGKKGIEDFGPGFPVVVGLVQAAAMLPGVSRSGTTISAGLFAGATREFSGLYSFLLYIPSVIAATAAEYLFTKGSARSAIPASTYAAAYLASALVGYGALKILLRFLMRGKLFVFAFYCFAAGIAGFVLMNS